MSKRYFSHEARFNIHHIIFLAQIKKFSITASCFHEINYSTLYILRKARSSAFNAKKIICIFFKYYLYRISLVPKNLLSTLSPSRSIAKILLKIKE